MKLIEKYLEVMQNKDYEALAVLFSPDGSLTDYCPKGTSQREYHVYGQEGIHMFFRNKFTFGRFSISEAEVINDHQAKYVANYGGYLVMAIATIRRTTEDGRIERMSVRPK